MTMTTSSVFANKAALIFGGAKGIGKAVALEWAGRSARVAITDNDAPAAGETAAEIEASGREVISIKADVTCDTSIAAAAAGAEAAFKPIEILMNNVGAALNGHPGDIPFSEWERITDLNYYGTVRAVGLFLPKMIARKSGYIVNTASLAGFYPYAASWIAYAAAKATVIALSQSLAIYMEPQWISVSCFIPGPVITDIANFMTSWTQNCPVRGPGAELDLLLPVKAARVLADGMEANRILILSDEKV